MFRVMPAVFEESSIESPEYPIHSKQKPAFTIFDENPKHFKTHLYGEQHLSISRECGIKKPLTRSHNRRHPSSSGSYRQSL